MTMMHQGTPTVYVVQEMPSRDYSDAERFGYVKFVTNKEWSVIRASSMNSTIIGQIRSSISEFDPHHDSIIMSGSPVTISLFMKLAMDKAKACGLDEINVLMWSNQSKRYNKSCAPTLVL